MLDGRIPPLMREPLDPGPRLDEFPGGERPPVTHRGSSLANTESPMLRVAARVLGLLAGTAVVTVLGVYALLVAGSREGVEYYYGK